MRRIEGSFVKEHDRDLVLSYSDNDSDSQGVKEGILSKSTLKIKKN